MLHVKWWSSHFSPDFIVFICISIFSGSEGIVPASFLQLLIDPFLTSQHDIRSRRAEQCDSSIQLKHLIVESKPITEKALSHPFSGKRIVKIFFRISHLRLVKTRDKFFLSTWLVRWSARLKLNTSHHTHYYYNHTACILQCTFYSNNS